MNPRLAAVVLGIAIVAGCGETHENQYVNRRDAANSIERGWIPEWLPKSASDVHERYSLDTNGTLVSFAFDERERDAVVRQCEAGVAEPPAGYLTRGVRWWPAELGGAGDITPKGSLTYFRCAEPTASDNGHRTGGLAVRTDRPVAYYWR